MCLEKHDLALSKLAAGREKDIEFIRELLKHRLINRGKLLRLVNSEINEDLKQLLIRNWTIVMSGESKKTARAWRSCRAHLPAEWRPKVPA